MAEDSKWPYKFAGQDYSRAFPQSVKTVGGARVRQASFIDLPDAGIFPGQVSPTVVTTASYDVQPNDELLVILRDNPVTTDINFRSVLANPRRPIAIIDWSTNVVEHSIRLNPFAGETIMKEALWTLVSTAVARAAMNLFPVEEYLSWMNTP